MNEIESGQKVYILLVAAMETRQNAGHARMQESATRYVIYPYGANK